MPFEKIAGDTWNPTRALISGPPNSRKTSSLVTWPFTIEAGLHVVFYPGEKGWDSLDTTIPGVHAYKWVIEDPSKLVASNVVKEVEQLTWDILTGKHGKCGAFAGDGLHKLYDWYYKKALAETPVSDDAGARAYGQSHNEFSLYLHRLCHSTVPYVVCTVWDGKEADKPELKSKSPTHIFPDLPGKMAKRIMGEFPVVLASSVGLSPGPGKPAPATWQIQPSGGTWGAGVKVPERIAKTLPTEVPQNWKRLEPLLRGQSLQNAE